MGELTFKQPKRPAPTRGKSIDVQDKSRSRSADWEDEEKASLLVKKLIFLVLSMLQFLGLSTFKYDKKWFDYVSELLGRFPKSCQRQWDTLLKHRKAISHYESQRISPDTSLSHVSYWKMTEEQKKVEQLPPVFPRARYDIMDLIYHIDAVKKTLGSKKDVDGKLPSPSIAHIASTITGSVTLQGPLDMPIRSQPSSSQYDRDSTDPPLPLANVQASQEPADVDKVSALSEENILSLISPFLTEQIRDTFQAQVLPLVRAQEENNQKRHQEKLLVLELKKLAVEVEKLAVEREKLAVEREKLAVQRKKLLVGETSSMAHLGSSFGAAVSNAQKAPHQYEVNFTQQHLGSSFGAAVSNAQNAPHQHEVNFTQQHLGSFFGAAANNAQNLPHQHEVNFTQQHLDLSSSEAEWTENMLTHLGFEQQPNYITHITPHHHEVITQRQYLGSSSSEAGAAVSMQTRLGSGQQPTYNTQITPHHQHEVNFTQQHLDSSSSEAGAAVNMQTSLGSEQQPNYNTQIAPHHHEVITQRHANFDLYVVL